MELMNGLKRFVPVGPQPERRPLTPTPDLVVAGAILITGALVAVRPAFALALVGTALVTMLIGLSREPAPSALVVVAILLFALVDLPRRIEVGPATAYGWITVILALLLVLASLSRYVLSAVRGLGSILVPLYAFAGWALLSLLWFPPPFAGIQNTLVYAAFAALVPVTAAAVISGDLSVGRARRLITVSFWVASGLYACSVALDGLDGSAVVGSRSYALVGVIGVAWGAANGRLGHRGGWALAGTCWLLILLSLSRLAFGAALVLLVIAVIDVRTPGRALRSAVLLGAVVVATFYAVTSFGPLASRFTQGDLTGVGGGVVVNVTGRSYLWRITWRSYLESPLIGKGAGSAEIAIRRGIGYESHPHNDFLRVLHDFGLVGLGLLVIGFVALAMHVARALRATRLAEEKIVHVSAGLALLGLALGMTTDNPLVYLFVVSPVAVLLGLSVGLAHTRTQGDR